MQRVRLFSVIILLMLASVSCNENKSSGPVVGDAKTVASIEAAKVEGAVSCSVIGFTKSDSVIYMQQGGKEFKPTISNRAKPSYVVKDMVWIPGGEFSMGNVNPTTMEDGGHDAMNDTRPVHRVYVKGYFMDKTEVT